MSKINLKYPNLDPLYPKVDIYLNEKKLAEIKRGEEKEISITESGELLLKALFRKAKFKVKKDCDYSLLLGWNTTTGKLTCNVEDSTDEDVNDIIEKANNAKLEKIKYNNPIYTIISIVGIVIVVISFLLIMNGIYSPIITFFPIIGIALIAFGVNKDKANKLYELINKIDFIGKNLSDIESIIGNHTSVNISTDDKRIYIWDDYLELLCNKDNVCVEVLKNIFSKK